MNKRKNTVYYLAVEVAKVDITHEICASRLELTEIKLLVDGLDARRAKKRDSSSHVMFVDTYTDDESYAMRVSGRDLHFQQFMALEVSQLGAKKVKKYLNQYIIKDNVSKDREAA